MPKLTGMFLALPLLLVCGAAAAQRVDANRPQGEVTLSDDTLQLRYIDNGKIVDLDRGARASGSFFLSEARDIVLSAEILLPAQIGYDRLQMYFGPRAYAALLEDENNDVLSLTLGAEIRYELNPRSGLAISGQAFYGPDILTFGTADNLTDLSARVEVRPQPRLTIFGGMRWFEFELTEDAPNRTLQEELFAGIGWRF